MTQNKILIVEDDLVAASEDRFLAYYKSIPIPTYSWQRQGDDFVLVDYNDSAEVITKGIIKNIIGVKFSEMYRDNLIFQQDIKRCFETKKVVRWKGPYYFKSANKDKYLDVSYIYVPPDLVVVHTEDLSERKKAEKKLRISEKRYRMLVENMNEGLNICDESGTITYVNRKFLEMLGYPKKEVVGCSVTSIIEEGERKKYREKMQERKKGGRTPYEITYIRKNGKKMYALVSPEPLFDKKGKFIGSYGVITDLTKRRLMEKKLRRSQKTLSDLSRHLQSVREDEARRIAREIHDELGQSLTAMKMEVSYLLKKMPDYVKKHTPIQEKVRSMDKLIDMTIRSIQRISSELRPGMLDDLGLVAAIEWKAQEFEKQSSIPCKLSLCCEEFKIDSKRAITLFRIFQEALTNVIRHANASRVEVSLKKKGIRPLKLELKVKDNGRGIKPAEIESPHSFGLMGMQERLRPFKGTFKIQGSNNQGTTLTVTLPTKVAP
jgi:two-component system sensor histidine kinase UhpB